jgi:nicotinate dehydrogenase subunit B
MEPRMSDERSIDLPGARAVRAADDGMTDVRAPAAAELLFGRVVRPPRILWDHRPARSAKLVSVDANAARALPGVVDVVVRGNFIGVVACSDGAARRAAASLRVKWSLPQSGTSSARPAGQETLAERGDVGAAMRDARRAVAGAYRWPLKPAPVDDACRAIADCRGNAATVWAATAAPAALRAEIAALLGLGPHQVSLVCMQNMRESGRDVHHAAADAALLSQAVGRPVQVQLAKEDIQLAADCAYPLVSHISSAVDDNGAVCAYAVATGATPPAAPPLALLLTGAASPIADVPCDMSAAIPPYAFANLRVTAAEAIGAAPLADPAPAAAMGHVFAHESHLDEIAAAANVDPVALRLRQIDDPRGAALIRKVADQAEWSERAAPRSDHAQGPRRGRGFAYASVVEADGEREMKSWSAWVVNVEVDTLTGDVSVSRVIVGHDAEHEPAQPGCAGKLEDKVIETTRGLTSALPSFDNWDSAATPQAGLPVRPEARLPAVEIVGQSSVASTVLRGGGSAMLPAAAALANAIFDATGVRLREPPFSAEQVRLALENQDAAARGKRKRNFFLAAAVAAAGVAAAALPWRAPIAPVSPPQPGLYSAAAIERGRLVAAAGDCAVCHTTPNGAKNAGGLALDTPFGAIYSTNITPDPETGIGKWSYAAFERAMREGIGRDGRHLYPAFPYTAFAKASDNDLQALYAYLMSQPAVKSEAPQTKLAFPFNMRPLMAGWNLLFHRAKPFEPNPAQSAQWNRGAYLAEGLGHCGACHTPRNAFGAEKSGKAYLAGGAAEGWEAPPLTSLSHAPIAWTEDELFRYLRFGYSPLHGPAAGPMAQVVEGLAELPESDVRAIAAYVASFNRNAPAADAVAAQAKHLEQRSLAAAATLNGSGARIYDGACAVCHQGNQGLPLFGDKPPLALNTNLHSARPDNLIQVLLKGIENPSSGQAGHMPAFGDSLNDAQLTELAHYLRARFAPDKPAWQNVEDSIARIRAEAAAH